MNLKSTTNMTKEELSKYLESAINTPCTFDDKALDKFANTTNQQSPYCKFKAKSDFYSLIFLLTVIFIVSVYGAITKNMELYVGIPIAFVSLLGFFIVLKNKKRF